VMIAMSRRKMTPIIKIISAVASSTSYL